MRRRVGDRRIRPRFEIVGELHGTIEAVLQLPLKNVSPGGCLVESPLALVPDSTHAVRIRCGDRETSLHIRVRHVRAAAQGETASRYLIGLEFLSMTPAAAAEIATWMAAAEAEFEV